MARSGTPQERLDRNPDAMRTRREVVEHPFGTIKMRMGATHFLMKTLPKVATEMALAVLGCVSADRLAVAFFCSHRGPV